MDLEERVLQISLDSLEQDKALDIIHIDLKGRSPLIDHMLIASGHSHRQVGAIADKLVERLKKTVGRLSRVEGREAQDWILVDAESVVIHIFRPEVRAFYNLEKLWADPQSLVK